MKHVQTYKRALALAVPMMIQNGITKAVGLVDNLMVGSSFSCSISRCSEVKSHEARTNL